MSVSAWGRPGQDRAPNVHRPFADARDRRKGPPGRQHGGRGRARRGTSRSRPFRIRARLVLPMRPKVPINARGSRGRGDPRWVRALLLASGPWAPNQPTRTSTPALTSRQSPWALRRPPRQGRTRSAAPGRLTSGTAGSRREAERCFRSDAVVKGLNRWAGAALRVA